MHLQHVPLYYIVVVANLPEEGANVAMLVLNVLPCANAKVVCENNDHD